MRVVLLEQSIVVLSLAPWGSAVQQKHLPDNPEAATSKNAVCRYCCKDYCRTRSAAIWFVF